MLSVASPTTEPAARILPYQIVFGVTSAAVAGIVAVLGELRDELDVSNTSIGVIVTAGFAASFVSQAVLAPLADRGHGRRMAVAGAMLASVSLAVMVVADSIVVWVFARAALGAAAGLIMPSVRRAATVLDPERAGENLGRLIVGEMAGFIAGPVVLAGFAELGGVRTPFLVAAIGMAAFVPFMARLPDDEGRRDESGSTALDLLGIRPLQGALILVFGYFVLIGAFEAVFPVMFQDRGAGALETGLAFTAFGVPIALISTRAGRVADRLGGARVAVWGMGASALLTGTLAFLPGVWLVLVVMVAVGIADGFGFTAGQVAVSQAVPEERQAAALGLMGAFQVLGAGVVALPAAALYDARGATTTWLAVVGLSLTLLVVGHLRLRDPVSRHG